MDIAKVKFGKNELIIETGKLAKQANGAVLVSFGGTVVLVLYVMLFLRNVKLVTRSPKAFGAFLAIGLSLLLTVQALANIAVSVNLVPATGLTLPLISMGGTSLLFTCISLGMILSVSKFIESIE